MVEKKAQLNIEKLEEKLKECEEKRDEYLAGWQRARADFLNYKNDETKRLNSLAIFAKGEVAFNLLGILDNFDLIEKNLSKDAKKDENIKGVLQIKAQILSFLKDYGVEEIEIIGKAFNPSFAEAVEMVEVKDKESGIITEELQKGYTLQGQVIRPAKVKVSK